MPKNPIRYVWKIEAPIKIKILIWLAYLDRLHTKDVLLKNNMTVMDMNCLLFTKKKENRDHIFLRCPFARVI